MTMRTTEQLIEWLGNVPIPNGSRDVDFIYEIAQRLTKYDQLHDALTFFLKEHEVMLRENRISPCHLAVGKAKAALEAQ